MKMSSNRIIFATLAILYFVGSRICNAQNTPEDYLRAHNAARAQVGVGPLRWDENVAAYARNYANQRSRDCKLVHSSGPYGENLAWSSGDMNVASAVKMWVDEKRFYNYQSNSCVGGVCGHYTQVVWRNSVRLGCARVRCNTGGTFITCNYDPPGNYIGQRPYSDLTEGHSSSS